MANIDNIHPGQTLSGTPTASSQSVTFNTVTGAKSVLVTNNSDKLCYVAFGATATSSDFPVLPGDRIPIQGVTAGRLQVAYIADSAPATSGKIYFTLSETA